MIRDSHQPETGSLQPPPPVLVEVVTDPAEIAQARAQWERFDRNTAWLQRHAHEVYTRHRGQHIGVAGEELFVAATVQEVLAQARAAHPDDDGLFVRYIPPEKTARIYAHRRLLAAV